MKHEDCLLELLTEELPPKTLLHLAQTFAALVETRLQKENLSFAKIEFLASPRRLSLYISQLAEKQPDQMIERKGPAKNAAFDAQGKPTPACLGFMRSCGIALEDLIIVENAQGQWLFAKQSVAGKSVFELLPSLITEALSQLPIAKRMRWGNSTVQFVRPLQGLVFLYGKDIIPASILDCESGRLTKGHRFHAPESISLATACDYQEQLKKQGKVIVDFFLRREMISKQIENTVKKISGEKANPLLREDLLNEVTGLVEWPHALLGHFDSTFLSLPKEVLISAMQDHQRYFPLLDAQDKLLPYFISIANIESTHPARVIQGNERVLRARLSDAAFFYRTDQKEKSSERLLRLKGISFQAKLGSLYEKSERISRLAGAIAKEWQADANEASQAGMLCKTDLSSNMVGEFPELQGIMGEYYALQEGEPLPVAKAIREHYLPRFAADQLPTTAVGSALAVADRLDTLLGTFGVNQLPTGDKDPYGLRRAALGVLRILIENHLSLDLKEMLHTALKAYTFPLENKEGQVLHFLQERLRAFYQEQGISADVFAAVHALGITNPLDFDQRIKAVAAFKKLNAAHALSEANKRVRNILAQYEKVIAAKSINPAFLDHQAEKNLALQIEVAQKKIKQLIGKDKYEKILLILSDLHQPVAAFFDQVMVMVEDQAQRENRLLLLKELRALFLQVADIALLQ